MITSAVRTASAGVEERAYLSLGASSVAIYEMVAKHVALVDAEKGGSGKLVDVGCGTGNLWPFVKDHVQHYTGADVVRYPDFPPHLDFQFVNLDTGKMDLADASVDIVVAVETIEHLENPRAFMRELTRVACPGGTILVTTPNQLSLLSLTTLVVKGQYSSFQTSDYPAHITPLLEIDLERIANECGLWCRGFVHSGSGRIAFTDRHYPSWLSRLAPRLLSDNFMLIARKPPV